jgi:hypothetical protein
MTTVEAMKEPPAGPVERGTYNSDGPPLRRNEPGLFQRLGASFRDGRKFEKPVAWLLGRQLMGSIKGILLYSAYGKKLDPRDWMTAEAVSFDPAADAAAQPTADAAQRAGGGTQQAQARNAADATAASEFWFDYISDTGDGMKATYSIAYLCMSDLYLPDAARCGAGQPVLLEPATDSVQKKLPRGTFLLIGGDTAYHASDYMTLATRIRQTFNWAYADLLRAGRLPDAKTRPIFGIPGNHDYYDQLDGFRRQFRHPVKREPAPFSPGGPEDAQLGLYGFRRTQRASYFALRLPFGWHLWALDTEVGQIDERQKKFFRQFCRSEARADGSEEIITPPDRLIVATCSPTTTFGKLADPEDYKAADAFGQLGIEQPFLPKDVKGSRRDDGTYDLSETGDARLRPDQCRLDLSGDVHHYARYWGPPPPAGSIPPRVREGEDAPKAEAPTADSYASVVSGIGGAFHHPSQTYVDEVREQSLYPSEAQSTAEVSRSIFKFWNIWTGGYVWLAGLVVAFVIYFAFTVPQSSRQALHNLPNFGLGLTQPEQIKPTVYTDPNDASERPVRNANGQEVITPGWKRLLGLEGVRLPPDAWLPPGPCRADSPRYFYGPCRIPAPWDFWVGILLAVFASVPLFVATFWKRLYERGGMAPTGAVKTAASGDSLGAEAKPSSRVVTPDGDEIKPAKLDPEIFGEPDKALWSLVTLAALMFFGGLAMVKPYRGHITPFGNSLLVLLTIVWACAGVALSLRYSEFLFKKSHRDAIRWFDWTLPWMLSVLGVISVALGLWSFGRNNLPALLISDAVFVVVLLGLLMGLIALPFFVAKNLLSNRGGGVRFAGKLLIGLWHFFLQVSIPLLLVRKGSPLVFLAVAVLVAVATWVGGVLLRRFSGVGLAVAWVIFGALTAALPFIIPRLGLAPSWLTTPWFATDTGWAGLVPSVVAGLVGAVMCCFWFGWYLGVCFAFNGHNNEVGGAARIERFKQFIRFRLTDDGVTGYVIGVNDPTDKGRELTPHVVDIFHLRPKPSASTGGTF